MTRTASRKETLVHALPAGGIGGGDDPRRIFVVGKAGGIGEGNVQLARRWGGGATWYGLCEGAKEGLDGVVGAGAGARRLSLPSCGAADPVAEGLYERLGANGADAPFEVFEPEVSPDLRGRRIREVPGAVGFEGRSAERGILERGGRPSAGQFVEPPSGVAFRRELLGGRAASLLVDRAFELAVDRPADGRRAASRRLGVGGFLVSAATKARAQDQGEDEDSAQNDDDLREEPGGERACGLRGELFPVGHWFSSPVG